MPDGRPLRGRFAVPALYARAVEATASGVLGALREPARHRRRFRLLLRVHLIRSARHSIDLQTFIFAEDDAGLSRASTS